jgi:hypothetical protein
MKNTTQNSFAIANSTARTGTSAAQLKAPVNELIFPILLILVGIAGLCLFMVTF